MNCSACDDLLIRKALEALGADEAERLDRHLEACVACRQRAVGDAMLFGALDALGDEIHAAEPTFVFRPTSPPTAARPARSALMPLMRVGLAIAAVWALVVLVGHQQPGNPGEPQPDARLLTAQPTARSRAHPVIRTAHVAPWLSARSDARSTKLRGRVRLAVPAYMPRSTFSAMKTPSILIRPRRRNNVDRNQGSRGFDDKHPVGVGPRDRHDARV